ncbi:class I SAM-dependent methyltransferase [Lentzea albidocapillata]|uniref:Methyltransferase domain-containing protein n=1 Tax=Lentzea albidocapillata TaxID=40571 RepID=A0A1W2F7Z9_9PSEU|nr:class I SAM-dependent methyltransferase [Lentzea albidocapillata]SMD18014.1 Methyltransferase domain-containing protein [Lentzea albidocapillata]
MTGPSTADPAAAEAVFAQTELALLDALPVAGVVADVGPGSGSGTLRLAERAGRVYAVDNDEAMLALVRERAEQAGLGDRVRTVLHDLDDGPIPLPEPVSLIWSGACVHHALSWQDAVSGLAGLLSPGGLLALGEGGLPARCLPWDVGVGRPGLEARLDAAHNEWFTAWFESRPTAVREARGWPGLLRSAGLEQVTSRSVLLDLPAPLTETVREVVLAELAARVGRAQAYLAQDDRVAWNGLLDRASPVWLGNRDDVALLTARTIHMGQRRGGHG